jgi:amino acid transporter
MGSIEVRPRGRLRAAVLHLVDLIPLSTSSVAPAFSIAAAYGVMIAYAGPQAIMAVIVAFPFFFFSALIFRQLNIHFPHAGASYFWGTSVIGRRYGSFQAWVVTLAYFLSLPPILLPAGEYTLQFASSFGWVPPSVVGNLGWEAAMGIMWALVAAVPLFLGAKPTARFTEAFLGIELAILAVFLGIGFFALPGHTVNPIRPSWFFSFSIDPLSFALALVVVATILDGWEIDSYAAEEAQRPRRWPGTSGVYGLLVVFALYLVTMPLITMETPLAALASSADPLATWVGYVMPSAGWAIDLAVIASTASSLWLTAFILSRAWYAMGRSGLLPGGFARVHRRFHSPWVAIAAITGAEIAVQLLELTSASVFAFFSLVLTAAGLFLILEFALNGITATVHFRRVRRPMGLEPAAPHRHRLLVVIGPITAGAMLAIFAIGLVSNPYLAAAAGALLVPSGYFLWRSRRLSDDRLRYAPLMEGEERSAPGE